MNNKIKKLSEIKKIANSLRKRGKKIVFTNGCFDILHYGHIKYLNIAKRYGDYLVVGLNSDSSVKKIKGSKRPIISQNDRAEILAALDCTDCIVIFNDSTPLTLMKAIKPNVIIKGGDWKKKDVVGKTFVESYNGKIKIIPFVKNRSSSSIIQTVIKRYARKG